jgi:hypothetical protein
LFSALPAAWCWLSLPPQVLRVSEELLRVSVLDDAALILLVRGCSQLQELELVQVGGGGGGEEGRSFACALLMGLRPWPGVECAYSFVVPQSWWEGVY